MKTINLPYPIKFGENDYSFLQWISEAIENDPKYGKGVTAPRQAHKILDVIEKCKLELSDSISFEDTEFSAIKSSINDAQFVARLTTKKEYASFLDAIA